MRCERSCRAVTEAASEAAGECEEVLEIFTNRLVALDPDSLASELCVRVVTVFCQVSASWLVVKYFW